jgi:hypothetical protein
MDPMEIAPDAGLASRVALFYFIAAEIFQSIQARSEQMVSG